VENILRAMVRILREISIGVRGEQSFTG
jgi:hypothetical protein